MPPYVVKNRLQCHHCITQTEHRAPTDCAVCITKKINGGRAETVFFYETSSRNPALHPGKCFKIITLTDSIGNTNVVLMCRVHTKKKLCRIIKKKYIYIYIYIHIYPEKVDLSCLKRSTEINFNAKGVTTEHGISHLPQYPLCELINLHQLENNSVPMNHYCYSAQ